MPHLGPPGAEGLALLLGERRGTDKLRQLLAKIVKEHEESLLNVAAGALDISVENLFSD